MVYGSLVVLPTAPKMSLTYSTNSVVDSWRMTIWTTTYCSIYFSTKYFELIERVFKDLSWIISWGNQSLNAHTGNNNNIIGKPNVPYDLDWVTSYHLLTYTSTVPTRFLQFVKQWNYCLGTLLCQICYLLPYLQRFDREHHLSCDVMVISYWRICRWAEHPRTRHDGCCVN